MPNRVQSLRSSVPGNLPQAGTRQPGELWVNFADFALGFIDSSQTAQKLLAVKLFVTTANYAIGDFVIQGGNLYRAIAPSNPGAFTAANWSKVGTAQDLAAYLPLVGGSLTGALTLAADPTANLGAATKQYVDAGNTATAAAATAGIAAANTNANTKLPLAGGTMTGPIVLAANPTAPLQPATKQYVDSLPSGATSPNRIDNGDMLIDQHNLGAAVAVPVNSFLFCPDRFTAANTQATSRFKVQQNLPAITTKAPGFPYFLGAQSTSAYTSAAAAAFYIQHGIEADAIGDLGQGTAGAQSFTVSFWAISSLTGNFSFAVGSGTTVTAGYRQYVTTYNLPTANTWTKITLTIPGDVTNPLAWPTGNVAGMFLLWDIGSGATSQTSTLNAWQTTSTAFAATGAVHVTGTNNATWGITGVKLEAGIVATPYPVISLTDRLARCQRYYQYGEVAIGGYSVASVSVFVCMNYLVAMRAAPTLTILANNSGNITGAAVAPGQYPIIGMFTQGVVAANGAYALDVNYMASAEI